MLNNITVEEYFMLEDSSEYDFYIDFLKPENKFCGNVFEVNKMTFNEFKTMVSIFNNPTVEDIKDLFVHLWRIKGDFKKSSERMFFDESIFVFFRAQRFVAEMVRKKLDLEAKVLYSEPDSRMIELGASKRLQPFNILLTKINLGSQFGLDPEIIGNWKYTKVINILAANNAVSQIHKDYAKK